MSANKEDGGSEILTSKCRGSELLDFRLHSEFWSELGDGGRRYRSTAKESAFSAPVAKGEKEMTMTNEKK